MSSVLGIMKTSDIEKLVTQQLERISQRELVETIHRLLVPVRCEEREWDYGAPNQTYPCWIVAEHRPSNTAVAYCEFGFGPKYPWGLLFIDGPHSSMGMDCGWFVSLEETVRDSMAWEGENPPDYVVS